MRSGSPTNLEDENDEAWHGPTLKASKHEIRIDKSSTEYIAAALLDPIVPEDEQDEYRVYVEQCHELATAPPEYAGRKDQKVYEASVALAYHGEAALEDIKLKDRELYGAYVEKGRPFTAEVVGYRENLPITFDYEKWLISTTT